MIVVGYPDVNAVVGSHVVVAACGGPNMTCKSFSVHPGLFIILFNTQNASCFLNAVH